MKYLLFIFSFGLLLSHSSEAKTFNCTFLHPFKTGTIKIENNIATLIEWGAGPGGYPGQPTRTGLPVVETEGLLTIDYLRTNSAGIEMFIQLSKDDSSPVTYRYSLIPYGDTDTICILNDETIKN